MWETVFMLLVLKIPVLYLAAVVWWAIRAEPALPEAAAGAGGEGEGGLGPRRPPRRRLPCRQPRRGGPHGVPAPARRYARARVVARTRTGATAR